MSGGCGSTYNRGCRCLVCRVANAERASRGRAARLALRQLVGDRLVAQVPAERHGRHGTYVNHGCRCEACTRANTDAVQEWENCRRRAGKATR